MRNPLFSCSQDRGTGVLVHPTSLPSETGIGNFGKDARCLVDFLHEVGMTYWQLCSLGPTGFGDSPYQCYSAFAGNPYLINLESLVETGLLQQKELKPLQELEKGQVDFGKLYRRFWPILRKAYQRFCESGLSEIGGFGEFECFKERHVRWLYPFTLYMALKKHYGCAWYEWKSCRTFAKAKSSPQAGHLENEVEAEQFYQYLFWGQWLELKSYANQRGIQIIGDIPIFVALDSACVWSQEQLFEIDSKRRPVAVAGVPPDYFSPTGQLWGNPLFDWARMKEEGYDWWMERMRVNFQLFDVVRLDHFRGFEAYWRVPFRAEDASKGKWVNGPGLDFFIRLKECIPDAKIIAEDLGLITPEVRKLLDNTGLPGMSVLQFAFEGEEGKNPYLPHNHKNNQVVYLGTHDNDTTRGWYQKASKKVQDRVRGYFGVDGTEISWDFIRAAYKSVCRLSIVSMQDLLDLGSEGRFNTPGTTSGNWQWRFEREQIDKLQSESAGYLKELAIVCRR